MAITITNDAASTRTNLGLGDAATKTTGTGAGNVPLNSNLSTVAASGAYADVSGTPTFKTVGGTSIEGSGNIESLPTGGSPGQVVTNTSSGAGTWQDVAAGGKVLQVDGVQHVSPYAWSDGSKQTVLSHSITTTQANSRIKFDMQLSMFIDASGGSWNQMAWYYIYMNGTMVHKIEHVGQNGIQGAISMAIPGLWLSSPLAVGTYTFSIQVDPYNGGMAVEAHRADYNSFTCLTEISQ